MTKWQSLPFEVRILILELLPAFKKRNIGEDETADEERTTSYATVCKEWQIFFEKVNFRRLILHPEDLTEFKQIVQRSRRRYVRHIWLRIELKKYTCRICKYPERRPESKQNNATYTDAVWRLFNILKDWKTTGPYANSGLTLELSAHSPSDLKHCFRRRHCLKLDDYPLSWTEDCSYEDYDAFVHEKTDHLTRREVGLCVTEPQTRWTRSTLWFSDEDIAIGTRVTGTDLTYNSANLGRSFELEQLTLVKRFVIRRQYFRAFDHDSLMLLVLKCVNLEELILERWQPLLESTSSERDPREASGKLSWNGWPKTLKKIAVFIDSDRYIHGRGNPLLPSDLQGDLHSGSDVVLADESCSLEKLFLTFLIDAKDFFQDFFPVDPSSSLIQRPYQRRPHALRAIATQLSRTKRQEFLNVVEDPDFDFENGKWDKSWDEAAGKAGLGDQPEWPEMSSLAFTSHLLRPYVNPIGINALFLAAARAAMRMPKLQCMELWNGGRGFGCVFRYERQSGDLGGADPVIAIASTWNLSLSPEVIEAWKSVARSHDCRQSVVVHLRSRNEILTSISDCQIRWEELPQSSKFY